MMITVSHATPAVLAFLLSLGQVACSNPRSDEAAPAPIDSAGQTEATDRAATPAGADTAPSSGADTMRVPSRADTAVARPDTSMATPPITPPPSQRRDTTTAGAAAPSPPSDQPAQGKGKISAIEYEGWRQYSVNCARCHGQDVLPNPVAANLLISVGPGGPMASRETFVEVVSEGRPDRGMPAFKGLSSPEQINAIYAYVKGRAEKRLPPGRPDRPGA
ncbi:MAG TPA: c-type cytochrome [Gemmatimonadales bacterium]